MTLYALFYGAVCNCKHIKIACIKYLVLFVVYILIHFYMPDSNGSLSVAVQQKLEIILILQRKHTREIFSAGNGLIKAASVV